MKIHFSFFCISFLCILWPSVFPADCRSEQLEIEASGAIDIANNLKGNEPSVVKISTDTQKKPFDVQEMSECALEGCKAQVGTQKWSQSKAEKSVKGLPAGRN